ncbi:TIGR03751 family conjugal transfer lipoprotein [Halomonas sp. wenzhen-202101]|uniref:TIGR03751 family conjugal transfer lipoprotein n=2 Tax=Halomonas dongshanensis TaxID=2890835 RepID=A0ABT2EHH9_9GAMM|nr:TIGR03751 family conjugal transfer lipoprotein [Halomonas dongshanensis]MCS2611039.1 TIGR03751 family conjugal transfer lipoprotein [Halomonas dongshanensis]
MSRTMIAALVLVGLGLLTGCATSKDELMPTNGMTMQELWQQGSSMSAGDAGQQNIAATRATLRRPITSADMVEEQTRYTREAANEIHSQFSRLPNPDLVIYIYPHLAGRDQSVPVPGYSTVFPLYQKPHYAMPGETARPPGRTR